MNAHLSEAEVNDYVDRLLNAGDRARIDAHIAVCDRCKNEIRELGELVASSRTISREAQAPRELWPLIAALTIYESTVTRRVMQQHRKTLAVIVATIVVLVSLSTAWLINACTVMKPPVSSLAPSNVRSAQSPLRHASGGGMCRAEWYLAMRDAAWLRTKQFRNVLRASAR